MLTKGVQFNLCSEPTGKCQNYTGEEGRYQGEGVFDNATQSPVAITILVKNPNTTHDTCRIHYRDIGGDLKSKEKLEKLEEAVSISGFSDWQIITPNNDYDWIEQRSDVFSKFYPLGSKDAKAGKADDTIFRLFSNGYKTGRDVSIYNFSRDACAENARRMTQGYLNALSEFEKNSALTVDEVTHRYATNIKWDRELKNNLKRKKKNRI